MKGSPPHTRGKVPPRRVKHTRIRITPAHAGKSSIYSEVIMIDKDHPRTRGEKVDVICVPAIVQGSPPHTRGKGGSFAHAISVAGITPAHAGKS